VILLLLCLLITCNLVLTVWIIVTLRINFQGMGSIQTVSNGTKIDGTAYLMTNMFARQITSSEQSSGLTLLSDKSISLVSVSKGENISDTQEMKSRIVVKQNIEMTADNVNIIDTQGDPILSIDKTGVSFGTKKNKLVSHSATLDSALQTREIMSKAGESLYIQSPTSYLKLEGNQGIYLNATSDNLSIRSLNNVDIKSRSGKVIITTGRLHLPNIPSFNSTLEEKPRGSQYGRRRYNSGNILNTIYQVCVCANGKLFLVLPDTSCFATKEICK